VSPKAQQRRGRQTGLQELEKREKVRKQVLTFVTFVFLLGVSVGVCAGTYSGGTGEPNDPYRIATANDLNDIGNHIEDFNKCFVMVDDINLAEYTGTQFNMIGYYNHWSDNEPFTGVFDGNEHAISNFTYESSSGHYTGLFGYVNNNAVIRNLGLIDPNVEYTGSGGGVGALAGGFSVSISDCYVRGGSLSGNDYVGGLLGKCNGANIYNCYSSASVSGGNYTGGLCGGTGYANISNCSSSGTVTGLDVVGGLAGLNYRSEIRRSYSTANVSGRDRIGGLAGINGNDAKIYDCHSRGEVSGVEFVGGLVGDFGCDLCEDATITNCYSLSSVSGTGYVGGLVGDGPSERVTNSFWDVNSSGEPNSAGGTGKTTAKMQAESMFRDAGWDFVEVWDIGENQTYPFLRVYPAGDLNHDGIVNFIDVAILAGHWLEEK
jgi:hypothetical protein